MPHTAVLLGLYLLEILLEHAKRTALLMEFHLLVKVGQTENTSVLI